MRFVPSLPRLTPVGRYSPAAQWLMLLCLSAPIGLIFAALHLPAALLLGPMVAAIALAAGEGTVRVPATAFYLAQGVIGCVIARAIPLSVAGEIISNWPLFLGGVLSVIVAAAALGWFLARWQVLPGTTAIWGSSPGAASAMVLMADAFGADVRLVAFMQYLRVVCVTIVATLVSRLWTGSSGAPLPDVVWFPSVDWLSFAETVTLAGGGAMLAHRARIPAGPLLVPLLAGVALQDGAGMVIELPPWLLAVSYAVIGWSIGLRFTRAILAHAARAFPRVLASTLVLIAICGVFAAVLVFAAGIDPLTAYLATSPGGADSVAIIAASSNVDAAFVMAMQVARFLIVLLTGPSLAKQLARYSKPARAA